MKAHHRAEGSPLKPADQQLTKGRILRIPSRKTADIRCPPGNSRNPHIQPRAYLPAEGFPVGVDIPGPDKSPVPLAPGPGTAHQVHRLLHPFPAQPLIKGPRKQLGIQIPHLRLRSHPAAVIVIIIGGKARLRLIQPEKPDPFFQIIFPAFFPEIISCLRIRHIGKGTVFIKKLCQINPLLRLNQQPLLLHFLIVFTGPGHLRPYGNHQLHAKLLQPFHHSFRIREKFLIKPEIPHSWPMEKVTYNHIQLNPLLMIGFGHRKNLFLVPITQLALPEAQPIFRHHGHPARDR